MNGQIEQLRPTGRRRVIDLVRDAGIDVSDWSNFKGGAARAATNPKYCYEWSFCVPGQVVVLNVWFQHIKLSKGRIIIEDNLRETVAFYSGTPGKGMWIKRAEAFDAHVSIAAAEGLPVRAIICDGKVRAKLDKDAKPSKVQSRMLDSAPWAVESYDDVTGSFILKRGALPHRLHDQFEAEETPGSPTETRSVTGSVYVRDPSVRRRVLERAAGQCEWCGELGFTTDSGAVFLETHHVVPLSEAGLDIDSNVAALCANHHREAHYGSARHTMRAELLRFLKTGKSIVREE